MTLIAYAYCLDCDWVGDPDKPYSSITGAGQAQTHTDKFRHSTIQGYQPAEPLVRPVVSRSPRSGK